jgi:hypothetical protein
MTRLDQIDGVESSAINDSGTQIRLTLRPGADPKKVAGEVQHILEEQGAGHVAAPITGEAAAAALVQETWRNKSQLATETTAQTPPSASGPSWLLAALLLGSAAIALGLLLWRHRNQHLAWCTLPAGEFSGAVLVSVGRENVRVRQRGQDRAAVGAGEQTRHACLSGK